MADESTPKHKIDWAFLQAQEGYETEPYALFCGSGRGMVSMKSGFCAGKNQGDVAGASGLTIGAGVDLRQMTDGELKHFRVPQSIRDKVSTLHVKSAADQKAALEEYQKRPQEKRLELGEVRMLNNRVREGIAHRFAWSYKKVTGQSFYDLDADCQTSLYSASYQLNGGSLPDPKNTNGAKFIESMKSCALGDKEGAAKALRSIEKEPARRGREADRLLQNLPKKEPPVLGDFPNTAAVPERVA